MSKFFKRFSSILGAIVFVLTLQFAVSSSALAKGGRSGDDSVGSAANKAENFQSNSQYGHIDAPGDRDTIKNDVTGALQTDGTPSGDNRSDSTNGVMQNGGNDSNQNQ